MTVHVTVISSPKSPAVNVPTSTLTKPLLHSPSNLNCEEDKVANTERGITQDTRLSACHVRQPIKITYCQGNILRYSGRRKQLCEDYLCRNLISFTQSKISASLLQAVKVLGFADILAKAWRSHKGWERPKLGRKGQMATHTSPHTQNVPSQTVSKSLCMWE